MQNNIGACIYNQNTSNCTAPRLSVQHCQPLDDQFAIAPPEIGHHM